VILLVVLLISCTTRERAGTGAVVIGIEGSKWRLVEVSDAPVSPQPGERRPFITFDATNKQASGFAGCNNFFGSYELDGSSLKFGPVGTTRMFCEGPADEVEMRFMESLEQTRTWELRDGTLLHLDGTKVLARFAKVHDEQNIQAITGTVWQWVRTLYNDDRKVVPKEPKNYTVQFLDKGALTVKADCNQKGGTYSIMDKRLSIEITRSTMAACPEGSLEDEFVRGLSGAAIYFIKDGDLYIDLKYDTGTMRFSKQAEG
jgi:heat shock protein HslJ